jgi:plastocyanin
MTRRIALVLTVLALVVLGACSEDNEVGSGVTVDRSGDGGTGLRLGETTTTAAAAPETTAAPAATTAPPATAAPTTAAPSPTTTQPQAQAFVINIYGDASGKRQFEPSQAGVRRGTTVRFVNNDSVARSVEATAGEFTSGPIAPGGAWEYVASTPGTFDYQDGTRPYATGQLVVQ